MPVTSRHIDKAVAIARRYGASRVVLFGRAQTDPDKARDLDIAVRGVPGWEFFEMAADLERTLRIPLDIIPLDEDTPFTRLVEERGRVLYES